MGKIKILFFTSNDSKALYPHLYALPNSPATESNDYLTDAIFQYMKNSDLFDVYECPWMVHMYAESPSNKKELTGFGFALRKELTQTPNILSVDNCIEKIKGQYFDYVLTDSRTVNPWWNERGLSPFYEKTKLILESVLQNYPKGKIIFFDGEDQTTVLGNLVGKVTYFKRELQFEDNEIHPIGYCFPSWKFRDSDLTQKSKVVATVIPGDFSTYRFAEENDYYEDYRCSMFALTWKKLGWDCFRHHEVLFSSCLPIFPDIRECPPLTLTRYPKKICEEILNTGILTSATKFQKYHDLYCYTGISIDREKISNDHYSDILGRLKEHSMKYLTSESLVEYIINTVDRNK